MTPLVSTGQKIRQILPSFLEGRKPNWPNPEQSTGPQCVTINGLQCWQAVGPALEIMEKLSSPIKELLDKNQEVLEQGESKPRAISFNMWMVGPITSANPTIVISSRSRRQRSCAKALLKESKLLEDYPALKIKTLERVPAVYRAGEPISEGVDVNNLEPGIYVIDGSCGLCGALISYGQSRFATMGGSILISGFYYGFSACHARFEPTLDHDHDVDIDHAPCFDDDSDSGTIDSPEITSQGSLSPTSNRHSFPTYSQSTSTADLQSGEEGTQMDVFPRIDTQTTTLPKAIHYSQVHQLPKSSDTFSDGDLDYELLALSQSQIPSPNVMFLPGIESEDPKCLTATNVVRQLVETTVYAATGTTGCVKGTILKTKHYIKMERSKTFQEMWAVRLERPTIRGDCGSWVVDARTGDIYGHIVAGDALLGIAFIMPAYKIWDDIQRRFGTKPVLHTTQSLTSSNSSRDTAISLSVVSEDSNPSSSESVESTANTISTQTNVSNLGSLPQYASQDDRFPHKVANGQIAPPSISLRVVITHWEDEGCLWSQVDAKGVIAARRDDNNMINGTELLIVSGITRRRRDGILKSQTTHQVVKSRPMHLKGVRIIFDLALDLANAEHMAGALYPSFVHNMGVLLQHPDNLNRSQRLDTSRQQNFAYSFISLLANRYIDGISPLLKVPTTDVVGIHKQDNTSNAQASNENDDEARIRHTSYSSGNSSFALTQTRSETSIGTWLQELSTPYDWIQGTAADRVQRMQDTIQMQLGPFLAPERSRGRLPKPHVPKQDFVSAKRADQDRP